MVKLPFSGYTISFSIEGCDAIWPKLKCFISMIISVAKLSGFPPLVYPQIDKHFRCINIYSVKAIARLPSLCGYTLLVYSYGCNDPWVQALKCLLVFGPDLFYSLVHKSCISNAFLMLPGQILKQLYRVVSLTLMSMERNNLYYLLWYQK